MYKDIKELKQEDGEILAISTKWVHPDWNPLGVRVGFIGGDGDFISAKWCDSGDRYENGEGMPEKWMRIPVKYERLEIILDKLFNEIKHGDLEHQQWLRDKMTGFLETLIME